jgi:hypothetical protein
MTPKEKAKELYDKYWEVDGSGYYRDEDGFIVWSTSVIGKQAKQCALIAVDEIIKFGNEQGIREPMMYWHKVKEELEKL